MSGFRVVPSVKIPHEEPSDHWSREQRRQWDQAGPGLNEATNDEAPAAPNRVVEAQETH